MSAAIEIQNLTKTYEGGLFAGQEVQALKDLSLEVRSGEIFGYLGPNGSGKTTTIKLLLGLIFPTSGTIKIFGNEDIGSPRIRQRIGFLPEGAYYPDFLKGEEILQFYGRLYGLSGADLRPRIDGVRETVGMQHARKRLLREYSKGMRQRIGLAQALMNNPEMVVLDEPTDGLDPVGRREVRTLLHELRDQGTTVFLNSHLLSELGMVCDRVAILVNGMVARQGTLSELTEHTIEYRISVTGDASAVRGDIESVGATVSDGEITIAGHDSGKVNRVIDLLRSKNLQIESVEPHRFSLEDIFVETMEGTAIARETVPVARPVGE